MRVIENLTEGYAVYDALASYTRLDILNVLLKNNEMNLDDISKALNITKGSLTMHIKKLEEAGLISVRLALARRGTQKLCRINEEKLIINIIPQPKELDFFETELDVGQYTSYNVEPTCGLSTTKKRIDPMDDPRYFSSPERFNAGIIWFTSGYVEYRFPNQLHSDETAKEIQISMELCSEAPGVLENYPSDIYFYVNDIELGFWTSPGELFDRPGRFTPAWWYKNFPQYGRMKIITINENGTYLDGLFLAPVTIQDIDLDNRPEISIKIAVPKTARHVGGVNIFGKGFGDYNEGIRAKVLYKKKGEASPNT